MSASPHLAAADTPAEKVEAVVAEAHPWIEMVARLGYAAKGFVYALLGVLAVLAAWNVQVGQRRNEMNQRGVFNFLLRQPYGVALLLTIAFGLLGYSLWRVLSASINPEDKGPWKRVGYGFSGLAYGYLSAVAFVTVFRGPSNPDDKSFARTLMSQPFGQVLLVVTGLVILAVAIGQAWVAIGGGFQTVFKLKEMKRWERASVIWLGRIGLSARAVLFGLIGGFCIFGGLKHDAESAGGLTEALRTLQHSIAGNWLLAADCAGLVCYGLFMFMEARYRHIRMADPELVEELHGEKP